MKPNLTTNQDHRLDLQLNPFTWHSQRDDTQVRDSVNQFPLHKDPQSSYRDFSRRPGVYVNLSAMFRRPVRYSNATIGLRLSTSPTKRGLDSIPAIGHENRSFHPACQTNKFTFTSENGLQNPHPRRGHLRTGRGQQLRKIVEYLNTVVDR